MNSKNDLDECLTYSKLLYNVPNFRIIFFGLHNLLLQFN